MTAPALSEARYELTADMPDDDVCEGCGEEHPRLLEDDYCACWWGLVLEDRARAERAREEADRRARDRRAAERGAMQ